MSYESVYGVSLLDDLHNYFPDFLYNNSRFVDVTDIFTYINSMIERQFNLFNNGRQLHQIRGLYPSELPHAGIIRPRQVFTTRMTNNLRNLSGLPRSVNVSSRAVNRSAPATAPATAPPVISSLIRSVFDVSSNVILSHNNSNLHPRILAASYTLFPQNNQELEEISIEGILPSALTGENVNTERITQQTEQLLDNLFRDQNTDASPFFSNLMHTFLNPQVLQRNSWLEPVTVRPTESEISAATTLTRLDNITDNPTCVICQEEITQMNIICRINHCNHQFHQNCIERHFQTSVRCPMCRYDIRGNSQQTNSELHSTSGSQMETN